MRIEVTPGHEERRVYLWLTREEAGELRDLLNDMIGQDQPDPAWHEHVSSPDYQTEITVAWEEAARP